MEYKPKDNKELWQGKNKIYADPRVAWLRWSNEIEAREGIMDEEFFDRNSLLVADASKELPLGNITDKKTVKLLRLRRMNMIRERDAGLLQLAEETMMANKADINTSRAIGGFNAKLNVTQRQIWEEKTGDNRRVSLLNRLLRGKQDKETDIETEGLIR